MSGRYSAGAYSRRSSSGLDCPPVTPDDDTPLSPVAKALRVFNMSDEIKTITFRTTKSDEPRVMLLAAGRESFIPVVVEYVLDSGTDTADLDIHAIID